MGYKNMVKLDYTYKKNPGGKPLEVLKKSLFQNQRHATTDFIF